MSIWQQFLTKKLYRHFNHMEFSGADLFPFPFWKVKKGTLKEGKEEDDRPQPIRCYFRASKHKAPGPVVTL